MKQLLVIAIALVATNAFASRARVISLSSSPHITDTQSIYSNPAKMFLMGDFANLESGKTSSGSTTLNENAEGMIVRSMGDAKVGLSLGHKSLNASTAGLRSIMTLSGGSSFDQQNPIELSYGMKSGDMTWAGTLVYSNYNDKVGETKENSGGVRLGALMGAWDFNVGIGAMNTAQKGNIKFKGTMGVNGYAGYAMENLYAYGSVSLAGAKTENKTSGAEILKYDQTDVVLGAVTSHKKDGNEFFYGASLANMQSKATASGSDTKTKTLTLPVIVGLEAEATSWLTIRGSLTQTVLINDRKVETGSSTTTDKAPGDNNTLAAIGAGLKFNKVTVDGSLQGLTGATAGQNLDGNTLLGTVGLTYMF